MKKCCREETKSDPVTNFIKNLRNLWETKNENVKKNILLKIKRRITLSDNVQEQEQDLISFIKQKIEPLDGKDKDKIKGNGDKPKVEKGGCCSCCDCLENKKNQKVEVEESQHELE